MVISISKFLTQYEMVNLLYFSQNFNQIFVFKSFYLIANSVIWQEKNWQTSLNHLDF